MGVPCADVALMDVTRIVLQKSMTAPPRVGPGGTHFFVAMVSRSGLVSDYSPTRKNRQRVRHKMGGPPTHLDKGSRPPLPDFGKRQFVPTAEHRADQRRALSKPPDLLTEPQKPVLNRLQSRRRRPGLLNSPPGARKLSTAPANV